MKLLRRWLSLRFRLQARYWKRRALLAERLLEAETNRNREREDTFVSASVLGGRGMFGLTPRSAPAEIPRKAIPSQALQTYDGLTVPERMEYEVEWLPDAVRHGISPAQAKQDFMAELAKRKQPLNDDPFSVN